ncbi:hypothetical protein LCGC14_2174990 [marine sediment metagenome]|uniref:Uncharacterized protein n=1 Tax=marine sediment metagenome TaxID=412755 RepID=A0A0F9EB68_9ZZZZ
MNAKASSIRTFIVVMLAALYLAFPVYAGVSVPDSLLTGGHVTLGSAQTITGSKTFADSKKACFGDNDDMCIYWDGTLGYIEFASAGDLLEASSAHLRCPVYPRSYKARASRR